VRPHNCQGHLAAAARPERPAAVLGIDLDRATLYERNGAMNANPFSSAEVPAPIPSGIDNGRRTSTRNQRSSGTMRGRLRFFCSGAPVRVSGDRERQDRGIVNAGIGAS
jgi:hypothetical protein